MMEQTSAGMQTQQGESSGRGKTRWAVAVAASMAMMILHFVANLAGVLVTDADDGRKKHLVTRRNTLKRVVRLLIHVEETRLKSR